MERNLDYQRRGVVALVVGLLVGAGVLIHLELSRTRPSVEYIGKDPMLGTLGAEPASEPLGRAPSSLPASARN